MAVVRRWGLLVAIAMAALRCADAHSPGDPLTGGEPHRGVRGVARQTAVIDFTAAAASEFRAGYPALPKPTQNEVEPPEFPEDALEHFLGTFPFGHAEQPLSPTPFPTLPSPPLQTSFKALDDDSTSIPPDTHGAVGPRHVMTVLNSQVRVQDRQGNVLSTMTLDGFWAPLGNPSVFDPRLVFDPSASRWIFAAVANGQSTNSAVLLAVSATDDPTGQWKQISVAVDLTGKFWLDFPMLGFNSNWIVVSGNGYPVNTSSTAFQAEIYIFDKARMYSVGDGAHTMVPLTNSGSCIAPAVTYDNTVTTEYLVQTLTGNYNGSGYLGIYNITGPVGSETISTYTFVPAAPTASTSQLAWADLPASNGNVLPQLGTSAKIEANDDRVQSVVYRGGSLWAAQTVFLPATNPTRSAVQWWELSTTGNQLERGLIDDPSGTKFFAFPSIAVNKNRDVLIGYSSFSSQQYPSADYALRMSVDPPSTLRTDSLLLAGTAPYFKTFGGQQNRWGDYSATAVDPVDDDTLWTVQEYAVTSNSIGCSSNCWSTAWGQVAPSSVPRLAVVSNKTVAEASPLAFTLTATGGGSGSLTYSAAPLPAGASLNTSTGAFTWTPNYGQAGSYPIRLGVTNGTQSTLQDITITVTKTNRPPVFSTLPPVSVFEGSTVSFAISATDPDNDPLTYSAGTLPAGATFTPSTRTFVWNTPVGSAGTYSLPFSVTDGTAMVNTTVSLTVIHVNHPPAFNAVAGQTVNESSALTFTVAATDPDNDPLTYSASGLPLGATFTGQTFNWTPAYGQAGTYSVTFLASDGSLDATTSVSITVNHVNRAPVPDTVPDQAVVEGQALTVIVSATAPDGDALTFASVSLPPGANFDPAHRAFSWTPAAGQAGSYIVKLSVTDGQATVPFSFNVSVSKTDHPPVFAPIAPQTVAENATLTFVVTATDPDGSPVTFLPPSLPTGATFDATQTFSWTPAFGQAGTYTALFTASDGMLQSSLPVTITVQHSNRAPVVSPIADQTVLQGQTLLVTINAVDPDNDPLTFATVSLPQGATFDASSRLFSWTPTYSQSGAFTARLTVSDGIAAPVAFSFNINVVHVDRPPVFAMIPPQSVDENQPLTFTVTASDPENDPLAYAAAGLPPGSTFDSMQRFAWTPAFGQAGSYLLTFTASDGSLMSSTTVQLTVRHVNRAPVITATPTESIAEGSELDFSIQVSDPDGDAVTVSATGLPDGAMLDSTNTHFTWTPRFGQAGTYPVTFTATDGQLSSTQTVTLTVTHTRQPPTISVPAMQTVAERSMLVFSVTASDADALPLSLSAQGIPMGATFNADAKAFVWTPDFGQAGTYPVTFTASDGTLTSTARTTITVTHTNQPPKLGDFGDKTVVAGHLLFFEINGSDPDADPLTFSASGLPSGAQFSPETRRFSWIPGDQQTGKFTATFSVSDGQLSDSKTVNITVTPGEPVPTDPGTKTKKGCGCQSGSDVAALSLFLAAVLRRRAYSR